MGCLRAALLLLLVTGLVVVAVESAFWTDVCDTTAKVCGLYHGNTDLNNPLNFFTPGSPVASDGYTIYMSPYQHDVCTGTSCLGFRSGPPANGTTIYTWRVPIAEIPFDNFTIYSAYPGVQVQFASNEVTAPLVNSDLPKCAIFRVYGKNFAMRDMKFIIEESCFTFRLPDTATRIHELSKEQTTAVIFSTNDAGAVVAENITFGGARLGMLFTPTSTLKTINMDGTTLLNIGFDDSLDTPYTKSVVDRTVCAALSYFVGGVQVDLEGDCLLASASIYPTGTTLTGSFPASSSLNWTAFLDTPYFEVITRGPKSQSLGWVVYLVLGVAGLCVLTLVVVIYYICLLKKHRVPHKVIAATAHMAQRPRLPPPPPAKMDAKKTHHMAFNGGPTPLPTNSVPDQEEDIITHRRSHPHPHHLHLGNLNQRVSKS